MRWAQEAVAEGGRVVGTRDLCWKPAMSTNTRSEENTSDTTCDAVGPDRGDVPTDHLDLPVDAQLLGVDGHGHTHLHSPRNDWICVVTPAGDVTHEQELGKRSVWDWVEHTEKCRGAWDELRYTSGGWVEGVVETIVRAQQDAAEGDR